MHRVLPFVLLCIWAGAGYADEEITVDLPGGARMEMVWIEPGTFTMGTTEEQQQLLRTHRLWAVLASFLKTEFVPHQVTLTHGFWLGKYEVTQEQWQAVMETNPSYCQGARYCAGVNQPVETITWEDAQAFVQRLNQAAGDSLYRLPTEAEWEYACRAGTTTLWCFGDDESKLGEYAWYHSIGGNQPKEVGRLKPNPWGLYDMYGNVWEWVADRYGTYSDVAQTDPQGPGGGYGRVMRGGGFYSEALETRSAYRMYDTPDAYNNAIFGTRLLRMGPKMGTAVTPQRWGGVKEQSH